MHPRILLSLLMLSLLCGFLVACDSSASGPEPEPDVVNADDGASVADTAADSSGGEIRIDEGLRVDDLILAPHPEPTDVTLPEGILFRAGSYNVYGGNYAEAAEIAAYLAPLELDMLGVQECGADMVAPLAEGLDMPYTVGTSGAVMFSRHPLTNAEELALPRGRGLVHANAEIEGVMFSLYALHISWDASGDVQTRAIIDEYIANDPNDHLVMVGDFNDEHYSTQITILDEVLADAFTDFGWYPGERISWPSTEFGGSEGAQLIDLIFYRKNFRPLVLDAQVFNQRPVLSDHKPTFAELLFPREAGQPFAEDPFREQRDPWLGFPNPEERPANLLVNPGAEDDLTGWETEGDPVVEENRGPQLPFAGERFFSGPAERAYSGGRRASGSQLVDLVASGADPAIIDAGRGVVLASGQMRIGYRVEEEPGVASNILGPNNHTEIIVEVHDADGELLLRRSSAQRDTYAYYPYAERIPLPTQARSVRYTWMAHQHSWYLGGCDVAFDDLYLGYEEQSEPNALLGGNLLANSGAELGSLENWQGDVDPGWWSLTDLAIHGVVELPPLSYSGAGLFFGGGVLGLQAGKAGRSTLAQDIDLAAWHGEQQAGELALRWGGWVRTWKARTEIQLALEIYDGDGSLWGTVEPAPLFDAEWTRVEYLTRIPAGASRVQMTLSADVEDSGTGVFADELFAIPERTQ